MFKKCTTDGTIMLSGGIIRRQNRSLLPIGFVTAYASICVGHNFHLMLDNDCSHITGIVGRDNLKFYHGQRKPWTWTRLRVCGICFNVELSHILTTFTIHLTSRSFWEQNGQIYLTLMFFFCLWRVDIEQ